MTTPSERAGSAVAPSRIARAIAAGLWPDVQQQTRITKGIYNFHCAGHGGIVAVIGIADLPDHAIDIARRLDKIELVAVVPRSGGRHDVITSAKYGQADLRTWCDAHPSAALHEAWIGEEDCDWAAIMYVAPAAVEAARTRCQWNLTEDVITGCLDRWNPEFRAAVDAAQTGAR